MTATKQTLADGTIELTVTIPWKDIAKTYDEVVKEMVKASELPGFRKGKAPRKLVEEKVDKGKAYEEVLKKLIPQVYNEAVTAQKIHPIITPKVELKEAQEDKDWVLRLLTCERPTVELGNYKEKVQNLKATKQKRIWVPGEAPQKPGEAEKDKKPTLDELLTAVYSAVNVKLPAMLGENEVNRLLSELIDQTKKLGMTVEQYLASTGRNAESLRAEYADQAQKTLTLEFALEEIADKEGIITSDDDINAVIKTAKTDAEKKALEGQRYYLAGILRRQKTLDFLASL